jgi:hypothetical protein
MLQANDAGRILLREGWQRLVPERSAVEQVWEGFENVEKQAQRRGQGSNANSWKLVQTDRNSSTCPSQWPGSRSPLPLSLFRLAWVQQPAKVFTRVFDTFPDQNLRHERAVGQQFRRHLGCPREAACRTLGAALRGNPAELDGYRP